MPSTRISETALEILRELSGKSNESMQAVLERALESYRRQCFLEESNAAFASLRENSEAWQKEEEERAEWDITLADGLEED